VVGTLAAGGRLADLLDGRQQEADQDGDDRDHHQQLDERKRLPTATRRVHRAPPQEGMCQQRGLIQPPETTAVATAGTGSTRESQTPIAPGAVGPCQAETDLLIVYSDVRTVC